MKGVGTQIALTYVLTRVAIRTAELNRRVQVTATKSWGPTLTETVGTEVAYQVAALGKREHPPCTERISLTKSADGRMATGAAWLSRN